MAAKVLGEGRAWHVGGTARRWRRLWLKGVAEGHVGGDEGRVCRAM